jgi:hypothetical protein
MASATNINDAQTPRGDAAVAYARKDNIAVPGADQTDPALAAVNARAATRETERGTSSAAASPKLKIVGTGGVNFDPDTADFHAEGSETSAP